jgi:hypothetical protein
MLAGALPLALDLQPRSHVSVILVHIETQKMKNEKQTVLTLCCFKDLQVLVTLFVCVSALDFGPYT